MAFFDSDSEELDAIGQFDVDNGQRRGARRLASQVKDFQFDVPDYLEWFRRPVGGLGVCVVPARGEGEAVAVVGMAAGGFWRGLGGAKKVAPVVVVGSERGAHETDCRKHVLEPCVLFPKLCKDLPHRRFPPQRAAGLFKANAPLRKANRSVARHCVKPRRIGAVVCENDGLRASAHLVLGNKLANEPTNERAAIRRIHPHAAMPRLVQSIRLGCVVRSCLDGFLGVVIARRVDVNASHNLAGHLNIARWRVPFVVAGKSCAGGCRWRQARSCSSPRRDALVDPFFNLGAHEGDALFTERYSFWEATVTPILV